MIVPKKASDSEIIRRVTGRRHHLSMPPRTAERERHCHPSQLDRCRCDWAGERRVGVRCRNGQALVVSADHAASAAGGEECSLGAQRRSIASSSLDWKGRHRPSPEADRVTLIRRLSLDLLGLPPTPAEVDAFLNDTPPDAYEQLVDGCSPRRTTASGRRGTGSTWPATPTPTATPSTRRARSGSTATGSSTPSTATCPSTSSRSSNSPATCCPSATLRSADRHRLPSQHARSTRKAASTPSSSASSRIVDRVNTTGTVWLGLTVGCCQCHDHKFDPITQREYYQLFAFFNNCDEPTLEILSPADTARRKQVREALAAVEKQLSRLDPTNEDAIEKWERSLTDETRPLVPKDIAAIFLVAPNGRNSKQKHALEVAYRRNDLARHVAWRTGKPARGGNERACFHNSQRTAECARDAEETRAEHGHDHGCPRTQGPP